MVGIFLLGTIALVALLSCQQGQKMLLKTVLHYWFHTVQIEAFSNKNYHISIQNILCANSQNTFQFKHIDFQWKPWALLTKRSLCIEKCHLGIHYEQKSSKPFSSTVTQNAQLAWWHEKDPQYGLLNMLQLPFKIYLKDLLITFDGKLDNCSLQNGTFRLSTLKPNFIGNGDYKITAIFKNPYLSRLELSGECKLALDEQGIFNKFQCTQQLRLQNAHQYYPFININLYTKLNNDHNQENLTCDMHYGPSNDLQITGKFFKKGPQIFSIKYQGAIDQTFFKILQNTKLPTLSGIAEGEISMLRKDKIIQTQNYGSAWLKNLENINPNLTNIPTLSLKTQINTRSDKNQFQITDGSLLLKQKGSQNILWNVNLLYPLNYHYHHKKLVPYKKDTKICEVNLHKFPTLFLNPLVSHFGYKIQGNIEGGLLELLWNAEKNTWDFNTVRPLHLTQIRLKQHDVPYFDAAYAQWEPAASWDPKKQIVTLHSKSHLINERYQTIFKDEQSFQYQLKNKNIEWNASLESNLSALFALPVLQPLYAQGFPNWQLHTQFQIHQQDQALNFQKLNVHLIDNIQRSSLAQVQLLKDFAWDFKTHNFLPQNLKGDIAQIQTQQLPLNFLNFSTAPHNAQGFVNYQGTFSVQNQQLQLLSQEPLTLQNFTLRYTDYPEIQLHRGQMLPQVTYDSKNGFRLNLEDIKLLGHENETPLLQGSLQNLCFQQTLKQMNGKLTLQLAPLFNQPLLKNAPKCVGETNLHWDYNQQLSANYHVNLTPQNDICNLVVQGSITPQEQEHLWENTIEIHHPEHSSLCSTNTHFQTTKDFNGLLTCNQLYFQDIFKYINYFQQIQQSVLQNLHRAPTSKTSLPFCNLYLANLKATYQSNAQGMFKVPSYSLKLYGGYLDGNLSSNSANVQTQLKIHRVPMGDLYNAFRITQEDRIQGFLNGNIKLNYDIHNPQATTGEVQLQAEDGYIKPFKQQVTTGKAIDGLTNIVSMFVGTTFSEMSTIGILNSYCQNIPFQEIKLKVLREKDSKIKLVDSYLQNEEMRLDVNGNVACTLDKIFSDQPFDFQCQIAAKAGPLLKCFNFDPNQKRAGYYLGPQFHLRGSINHPDYSDLMQLLIPKTSNGPSQKKGKNIQKIFQLLK